MSFCNVIPRFLVFFILINAGVRVLAQSQPLIPKPKVIPKERVVKRVAPKEFTVYIDTRYYYYNEPGYVTHSGLMYGGGVEYSWNSYSLGKGKLDSSLIYGNSLNYDGSVCTLSNSCTPYQSTTKDLIVRTQVQYIHEFDLTWAVSIGLGYRYLNDKGDGSVFYTRTGNWMYVPVGVQYRGYGWITAFEFDYIFYATMRSNLSEVSSALNDIEHRVSGGYGLKIQYDYLYSIDWKFGLYYELWKLPASDTQISGSSSFVEPENSAASIGIKAGYNF